jgi:hypothetical protein
MKVALSLLFVLGLTALARAQVQAPSVSIDFKDEQVVNLVLTLSGVSLSVNGVEIRADLAELDPFGNQLRLQNATLTLTEEDSDALRDKALRVRLKKLFGDRLPEVVKELNEINKGVK